MQIMGKTLSKFYSGYLDWMKRAISTVVNIHQRYQVYSLVRHMRISSNIYDIKYADHK